MKLYIRKKIDHGAKETVLLLHGLGSSGAEWEKVVYSIGEDYNIIVVDLAGFGKSDKPDVQYTPEFHAKNIIETMESVGVTEDIILICHSLSTLIAPDLILMRPTWFKYAIFCSPPYYKIKKYALEPLNKVNPSNALLKLYSHIISSPNEIINWIPVAVSMGIIPKVFEVNKKNIHAYASSMQHCIINQNILQKLKKITIPTTLIHGKMDPLIVQDELLALMQELPANFRYEPVISGHRVQGHMRKKVSDLLKTAARK